MSNASKFYHLQYIFTTFLKIDTFFLFLEAYASLFGSYFSRAWRNLMRVSSFSTHFAFYRFLSAAQFSHLKLNCLCHPCVPYSNSQRDETVGRARCVTQRGLVTVAFYHRLQCPLLTGPWIFATCLDAGWRENVSEFMAQNHIMSSKTKSVLAITLIIIVFLVLSCYESSMREKQWAVHKQFLLPVKTSSALMHNKISLLKHYFVGCLELAFVCTR